MEPIARCFVVLFVILLTRTASSQTPEWTAADLDNIQHLFASFRADTEATRLDRSAGPGLVTPGEEAAWLELIREAHGEALQLRDDVLRRAHPDLPWHLRNEYQRSLELLLEAAEEGDNAKSALSGVLHDRWVDWWNAARANIRIPRR